MQTHLTRRAGGRYYLRRRIPLDLLEHFKPRKEITKALGTSERREAEKRVRVLSAQLDAEFDSIREKLRAAGMQKSAKGQIQGAGAGPSAEPAVSNQTDKLPPPLAIPPTLSDPLSRDVTTEILVILAQLRHKRTKAEAKGPEALKDFIAWERFSMTASENVLSGTEESSKPLWWHEANIAARRQFFGNGDSSAIAMPAQTQQPGYTHAAQGRTSNNSITLDALIPLWERDKNPRDPKTVAKTRLVVRRFTEKFSSLPVQEITRRHCIEFRDVLLAEGQSIANVNNYLPRLSALLNVAHDRDYIPQNPATRLTLKDSGKKRYPFDIHALVKIFTSSIYLQAERPKAGAGEAAYWLPLLALFTGARVEELAQLHPNDVRSESYDDDTGNRVAAWVINITGAGDGQEVKNAGSVRIIPVHADLIRLGFIEFVEERQYKPRIFYELRADITGRESGTWSKWFGRWLRKQCSVTDKRMVFHSFRYTFKDLCRDAEIEEAVHDAFTGHAGGNSVARDYSSGLYPIRPLVRGMNKFRLPAEVQKVLNALPKYRV